MYGMHALLNGYSKAIDSNQVEFLDEAVSLCGDDLIKAINSSIILNYE